MIKKFRSNEQKEIQKMESLQFKNDLFKEKRTATINYR